MIEFAVDEAKPYDRKHLEPAEGGGRIRWRFQEFRLSAE